MKKYIDPIPNGGAPLHNNRLSVELQKEFWSAIEGHMNAFANNPTGNFGIIVSGCEIVANGGGFDIAAGVVFLNGEFMRLAAATGQSFTKYIAPAAAVNTAKTFADSVSRNLLVDTAAELVGSAPGSGQYITISSLTSANPRYLKGHAPGTIFRNGAGTESFKVVKTKIVELLDWDMETVNPFMVNHGIADFKKIIGVTGVFRPDGDASPWQVIGGVLNGTPSTMTTGIGAITSSQINIYTTPDFVGGGFFDETGGYIRGYLFITYTD